MLNLAVYIVTMGFKGLNLCYKSQLVYAVKGKGHPKTGHQGPQTHTIHCVSRTQSFFLPGLAIFPDQLQHVTGKQTCFVETNKHVTYMCKTLEVTKAI
jgi:hypothetical protein